MTHNLRSLIGVGAIAAFMMAASATPAAASPVTAPNGPSAATSGVDITYTAEAPADTAPDLVVGESATVTNADGSTTTYTALASSCTETITTNTPYKGTYNGSPAAIGTVSAYRSSGCVDTYRYADAGMDREACGWYGCRWRNEVLSSTRVSAGTSVQFRLWSLCNNTNSDRWRTSGAWDGLAYQHSAAVWLNCGK